MERRWLIFAFVLAALIFLPSVSAWCIDSDGGQNFWQFGFINFTVGNESTVYNEEDFCGSSVSLAEQWCNGAINQTTYYSCPTGSICSGGMCVNQTSTNGTLSIYSTPSGASIYDNGVYKQTTPRTYSTNAGSHTIILVKSGYYNWTTTVTVYSGQTTVVNATLVLIPPTNNTNGTLAIYSTPSNAWIYDNGVNKGLTPQIYSATMGSHIILLSKTGYNNYTTTVQVYTGQTTTVNATLTLTGVCADSDGGIVPTVKGYTTLNGGNVQWDSCTNTTFVQERYCFGF